MARNSNENSYFVHFPSGEIYYKYIPLGLFLFGALQTVDFEKDFHELRSGFYVGESKSKSAETVYLDLAFESSSEFVKSVLDDQDQAAELYQTIKSSWEKLKTELGDNVLVEVSGLNFLGDSKNPKKIIENIVQDLDELFCDFSSGIDPKKQAELNLNIQYSSEFLPREIWEKLYYISDALIQMNQKPSNKLFDKLESDHTFSLDQSFIESLEVFEKMLLQNDSQMTFNTVKLIIDLRIKMLELVNKIQDSSFSWSRVSDETKVEFLQSLTENKNLLTLLFNKTETESPEMVDFFQKCSELIHNLN